jgi:2,4-dienoyl-CoA reductase (NADPH2)
MSTPYPHLLEPITIAGIPLRNRTLMGSMHVGLEEDRDYGKIARYFQERAEGGAGLIVTGGIAPNRQGWTKPFAAKLSNSREAKKHRTITRAVHDAGGHIAMQILHTGRYGYHPFCVAPSAIKAPIGWFKPRALSKGGIQRTIRAFANSAALAKEAGYDGVEVMGSEGYLINQFIAQRTNKRDDEWGGTYENRIRFPLEIVRAVKKAVGEDFIVIFRLSMLDLVEGGSSWPEVVHLALELEKAGVGLINTGIGWHEARIPTIATMVPRAAFTWVTKKLKAEGLNVPMVTSNRINKPDVAERVLAEGSADMISMARPFLADAAFVKKAEEGRADEINVCIACNQACLDHVFQNRNASCLVNPRACHETELVILPAKRPKKVAVVGGGPAGLSCATVAAERGHQVTLFEASSRVGGQFHLASRVPGKEEFKETIGYFERLLEKRGVMVRLGEMATAETLKAESFDHVVVATGVKPRKTGLPGEDGENVLSYVEVLSGAPVGEDVVIIGAGGIGYDVAEYLVHSDAQREKPTSLDLDAFLAEWGIDPENEARGGVEGIEAAPPAPARRITVCQRSATRPGKKLGKTTGWIHRATLKHANVQFLSGVVYEKIDAQGLHVDLGRGPEVLACDHVVICAGQVEKRDLFDTLVEAGISTERIGGADVAAELDAKRAIKQGAEVANRI